MTTTEMAGAGPGAGAEPVVEGTSFDDVRRWRARAAAAVPADRAAAEAGVRRAYRQAGLPEPERVVWAASPRAAVTLVRESADKGPSVREAVRSAPWAGERQRLHTRLGAAGWAAHWAATGGLLWDTTQALVDRIRAGVLEELAGGDTGKEAAEVRLVLLDAVLGQHDAPWLAAFPTDRGPLEGLAAVSRHAGWWWPFARVAVVCERPVALHRDEAGRLDHGDGPALAYSDGFALYAWRGMPVPAGFLAELRRSPRTGSGPRRTPNCAGSSWSTTATTAIWRTPGRVTSTATRRAPCGGSTSRTTSPSSWWRSSTPHRSRTERDAPTGCGYRRRPARRGRASPGPSS